MTHFLTSIENLKFVRLTLAEIESHIPPFSLDPAQELDSIKNYLKICDEILKKLIINNILPSNTHLLRSKMIDQLIMTLFLKHIPKDLLDRLTLIAVGGYGREEMSLYSDIDLLFLTEGISIPILQPAIEKILYPLWDAKLDVGHAVRNINECLTVARNDHTVLTALLNTRWICGHRENFYKLKTKIENWLSKKSRQKKLIHEKIEERTIRLKKYGHSVYLLKPNLKESDGALRDLQVLRWITQASQYGDSFGGLIQAGLINEKQFKALDFAFEFFLKIRNLLHLYYKKRNDQMNFEPQIELAKNLHFEDSPSGILAVERFMQAYYTLASQNRKICETVISKILIRHNSKLKNFLQVLTTKKIDRYFEIKNKMLSVADNAVFEKEPTNLIKVFALAQKHHVKIDFETQELITNSLYLVDKNFRENYEICQIFRNIMSALPFLGQTLLIMHETQFFDAFIPEFRKLRNRVQHDIYHVYTVDTHSIFAVNELSRLSMSQEKESALFSQALAQVKRKDILTLGLLFHDIGKCEGGNHAQVGAQITSTITRRLGYNEADQKKIEFLVLSHLLMSRMAQRRDLEDLHLIFEFAKSIESLDNLNMLFTLTWADIRAVSSESWTEWKGSLLKTLYEKTCTIIAEEMLSDDLTLERVSVIRQNILLRLKGKIDEKLLYQFLETISPRYVRSNSDEEILEHFHLIQNHKNEIFIFEEKKDLSTQSSQILLYTEKKPQSIALVTGVMLSFGINILALEVYTLGHSFLFFKMQVQSDQQGPLLRSDLIQKLKLRLENVLAGRENAAEAIAKYKRPYWGEKHPVGLATTKIDIDNDISAFYTIIDIFTHDRVGLLYDIMKCLIEEGCHVEVSKISTQIEQVVDTFYVKDRFGNKITSEDKLHEIKDALMKMIESKRRNQTA